jgi:hypothetical protein
MAGFTPAIQSNSRALHGARFQVVKRIGYFVPQMGRPPRSSPGNSLVHMSAVLISGGEEFGYFGCPDQSLALRGKTHPLEG